MGMAEIPKPASAITAATVRFVFATARGTYPPANNATIATTTSNAEITRNTTRRGSNARPMARKLRDRGSVRNFLRLPKAARSALLRAGALRRLGEGRPRLREALAGGLTHRKGRPP